MALTLSLRPKLPVVITPLNSAYSVVCIHGSVYILQLACHKKQALSL